MSGRLAASTCGATGPASPERVSADFRRSQANSAGEADVSDGRGLLKGGADGARSSATDQVSARGVQVAQTSVGGACRAYLGGLECRS